MMEKIKHTATGKVNPACNQPHIVVKLCHSLFEGMAYHGIEFISKRI